MRSARKIIPLLAAALILFSAVPLTRADPKVSETNVPGTNVTTFPLQVDVEAAVLMDFTTGKVLFSKNPDRVIPPASLTKLMTLHILQKKIKSGDISENDVVDIPEEAYASRMPPRSSLMFLGPGQRVTLLEIMKGLAVCSGNDAAVAAALYGGESVSDFVTLMNREAGRLGLPSLHFEDAAGLSARNRITPLEFARFCRIYVREHPQSLEKIHSLKQFTYPKNKNLPETDAARGGGAITQYNRNLLLWRYPGVDGLKTGYIDESGFNLALTAEKNGMRLIGVLLGGEGSTPRAGLEGTARDGAALLDYGFNNFVTVEPKNLDLEPVSIWKGRERTIPVAPGRKVVVTVERELENRLQTSVELEKNLEAPKREGEKIGVLTVSADNMEVERFDLVAEQSVERGSPFRVAWDTIRLWWNTNMRKQ